jgi:acetyltransferase-like isoleucine patch superfamily enzyme
MQKLIADVYRIAVWFLRALFIPGDTLVTYCKLYLNNVSFSQLRTRGVPKIYIERGGRCTIGARLKMNNREMANPIGRFNACSIVVCRNATLVIGKNVGMSSTAIYCADSIDIADDVNIGGNVVIYDTDFHAVDPASRMRRENDKRETKTKRVKIGRNAFIGAHTTILKGSTIGENAVIGACSVVTGNIPANEIWAGNPAKFIRTINGPSF